MLLRLRAQCSRRKPVMQPEKPERHGGVPSPSLDFPDQADVSGRIIPSKPLCHQSIIAGRQLPGQRATDFALVQILPLSCDLAFVVKSFISVSILLIVNRQGTFRAAVYTDFEEKRNLDYSSLCPDDFEPNLQGSLVYRAHKAYLPNCAPGMVVI